MIFIIIINILLIIWIYKKYIYIPKIFDESSVQINELDPALIGYIDDRNGNSIDWILSEILSLNKKGFIEIEYVREDIDKYEYIMKKKDNIELSQLKKYELTAYRFLFSESDEISMTELEEKILRSMQAEIDVNVKSVSIRNEIEEELIKQNIIDYRAKEILSILKKVYFMLILISICLIENIQLVQGGILFVESIIVFLLMLNATPFTKKGKSLYSRIQHYKKELEYNEILKEKKIMHNILFEKIYLDSIALHIMSEARKEFIHDELIQKNIKKGILNLTQIIFGLIYIVAYSALLYLGK